MSRSLNKCDFIGNVTRDPELRYTAGGTAVVDLGIAVNESYKKDDNWVETVTYVNFVGWDRLAEKVAAQYKKGDRVYVTSKLKMDSWEDKKTGEKRTAPKFTILDHWPLAKDVKVGETARQEEYSSDGEVDSGDEDEDENIPF